MGGLSLTLYFMKHFFSTLTLLLFTSVAISQVRISTCDILYKNLKPLHQAGQYDELISLVEDDMRGWEQSCSLHAKQRIFYYYGRALRNVGRINESINVHSAAIPEVQGVYIPWISNALGVTSQAIGNFDAAKSNYERAIEQSGDEWPAPKRMALNNLIRLHLNNTNDYEEATRLLEEHSESLIDFKSEWQILLSIQKEWFEHKDTARSFPRLRELQDSMHRCNSFQIEYSAIVTLGALYDSLASSDPISYSKSMDLHRLAADRALAVGDSTKYYRSIADVIGLSVFYNRPEDSDSQFHILANSKMYAHIYRDILLDHSWKRGRLLYWAENNPSLQEYLAVILSAIFAMIIAVLSGFILKYRRRKVKGKAREPEIVTFYRSLSKPVQDR